MTEKLIIAMKHPEPAPEAKYLLETLLQRCFVWLETIKQKWVVLAVHFITVTNCTGRQGRIAPAFKDTYDKLLGIRNKLEKLSLTQAWSMRETDLWSYQRQLDRIDEARVDGNFLDALGRPAEIYEQRVCTPASTILRELTLLDTALPSTKELCYNLPSASVVRTCLRSLVANLQPAYDSQKVLA
jgi:hypothetical protein